MSHSVSCGACNATFSIPDEVWEKRVEGQLATLKCRHCRAPIQIDGRTKRNANALIESRGVADPKPAAAAIATTSSKKDADTSATRLTSFGASGAEDRDTNKSPLVPAVGSVGTSSGQAAPKNEQARAESAAIAS